MSVLASICWLLDAALTSSVAPLVLAAVVIYAVVNLKVLPFAWHARMFYGYFRHYYIQQKRPLPASTAECLTIFQPTIYTTTTPLGEIDFGLHKSNSTYLTDLDMARGHHIYTVFRPGFQKHGAKKKSGMLLPMLGGTTCTFRKEVKPLAKVDIWTRVLSWDSKWIYIVSHFVRAGEVKPSQYTDQAWRTNSGRRRSSAAAKEQGGRQRATGNGPTRNDQAPTTRTSASTSTEATNPSNTGTVYATCISKYVLKANRKTVPPEEFFWDCGLLSDKTGSPSQTEKGEVYRAVEERRQKGMALASHVAALDEGHQLFNGDMAATVLAKY
ncbi:hypothetical protein B0H66DRAFT_553064 [Apodospora peruviana]|uniref:Thioesterase n=1 Tax=Apodospora peruviana TaxID=516989 RepID=A0AAE0IBQ6_9PEZI|nr:hypothetical protein B0H66DRAFT_553064 [Apodospora peruviana]